MVMSKRYPIISITGSSVAGTTSVRPPFEQIFQHENVKAAYIEGTPSIVTTKPRCAWK